MEGEGVVMLGEQPTMTLNLNFTERYLQFVANREAEQLECQDEEPEDEGEQSVMPENFDFGERYAWFLAKRKKK